MEGMGEGGRGLNSRARAERLFVILLGQKAKLSLLKFGLVIINLCVLLLWDMPVCLSVLCGNERKTSYDSIHSSVLDH